MKTSISSINPKKRIKLWQKLIAVLIWLLIWQFASVFIKQEMLLASPISVLDTLSKLIFEKSFWMSIIFSLSRVISGFSLAFTFGIIFAGLAYKFNFINIFLNPIMGIIKTTPVVSYIILSLLFFSSKNLPIFISFLMTLPIIYVNISEGLENTDKKLLEMAKIFNVSKFKQIIYIYLSHLTPFLVSACSLSLGLCWKSAITAEVLALPNGSIGENIYQAKIFVDTKTLLAWTVVVIIISFSFEKLFLTILKKIIKITER